MKQKTMLDSDALLQLKQILNLDSFESALVKTLAIHLFCTMEQLNILAILTQEIAEKLQQHLNKPQTNINDILH
jgi:hypothetical protein